MAERYDAVVIGAGPAGEVAAGELADGGMRVAIVERELVARRVLVLGLHPVEDAAAPGRGGRGRARGRPAPRRRSRATIDVGEGARASATSWSPTRTTPARSSGSIDKGHRPLPRRGRARRSRPRRRRRPRARVATTSSLATGLVADRSRRSTGCATSTASGPTARRPASRRCPRASWSSARGPVGVEMAQILHRLGARVDADRGLRPRRSRARPRPPAVALEEALRDEGIDVRCGVHAESASMDDGQYVLTLEDGAEVRAREAAGRHRPRAAGRRHRARDDRRRVGREGRDQGRRPAQGGRRHLGDRRHHRHRAVHARRQVPGARLREGDPRQGREGRLHRDPACRVHRPAGGRGRRGRGRADRHGAAVRASRARRPTRASTRSRPGFLTLVSDGSEADRRLRGRPRGGRVARPGDARDQGRGPGRRAARHDPAVPDVLRGVRERADRPGVTGDGDGGLRQACAPVHSRAGQQQHYACAGRQQHLVTGAWQLLCLGRARAGALRGLRVRVGLGRAAAA